MAKQSMKNRDQRRKELGDKFYKERERLKAIIVSVIASDDEKVAAELKLQSLPRDSSPSRQRNRCRQCGRSRAYNRLTGLCRIHMRDAVTAGFVPGMHKASW